ncbi:MAG: NAD(P)H-binding protein [Chloroflexi bacterium]|uniref:NAD(P)H-binding protein n=1 Tax=Candidatus Chlorohelix allophototropha TaxID=3003348 RepID=A0A8T7M7K7_9CHLR|nr:NAD(P)H-binding protein [Chloroflexota bacterium]WJW68058.1 NAD(P)H-binding protein [Chloroflexota bacterium L227-S17]
MILVIGSTGFIGRNLVPKLLQSYPGRVRVLVRSSSSSSKRSAASLAALKKLSGLEIVEGDVLNPASLAKAMKGIETVFDYAQVTANYKDKDNIYWRVNVEGTKNVVAAAEAAGVKRFILGSGLGTIQGKPGSYMRTRWEAEQTVRNSKLNWTILQPSILFGRGAEFFEAQARIIKMLPIATIIGNGKIRFQPIYVEDVVTAAIECINRDDKIGKAVAFGGPATFTYKELISLVVKNLKKQRLFLYLPLPLARINAALFNMLPEPPLTPATLELFDFENTTGDDQILEKEFGIKAFSLHEYLEKNSILG